MPLILPGVTITGLELDNGIHESGLNLELHDASRGMSLLWIYDRTKLSSSKVARMAEHLLVLLNEIAINPSVSLSELKELLGQADENGKDKKLKETKESALLKLRNARRKNGRRRDITESALRSSI